MSAEVTPTAGRRSGTDRFARLLSEVGAPWVIVLVLPVAVARQATHHVGAALGWGLLVALTSSILPMGVMVWGARTGRWDGHHARDRAGRLVPFIALIGMSAVGLVLLVALGAPWLLIALDISMIAALLVTGAITARWKISMHAAVAAGAVATLAVLHGPAAWALLLAVAAISWSRVHLGDHTPAQVAAGALVGLTFGGALFAGLA
ncbi:hypothetical protein [Saccharopolyspora griseoalba]|uniref:PAP2 superfamily protein n=1 Tax=Saccharopolyspora griseoalba TaxID=1431848 RepID=A0ABW2LNC7_9PSEU